MSPVSLILPVLLHDVVGDVKGGGSGGRRRRMHINNSRDEHLHLISPMERSNRDSLRPLIFALVSEKRTP